MYIRCYAALQQQKIFFKAPSAQVTNSFAKCLNLTPNSGNFGHGSERFRLGLRDFELIPTVVGELKMSKDCCEHSNLRRQGNPKMVVARMAGQLRAVSCLTIIN